MEDIDDSKVRAKKILENRRVPIEIRHTFANVIGDYLDLGRDPFPKIIIDVTDNFVELLSQVKSRIQPTPNEATQNKVELFDGLYIGEMQHVLLLTVSNQDSFEVARKIAYSHNKGALMYVINPRYKGYIEPEIKHLDKRISFLYPPVNKNGHFANSDGSFNKNEAMTAIANHITEITPKPKFLKGVTLTASSLLMELVDSKRYTFLDYEKNGNAVIQKSDVTFNVPISWICLYSLEELRKDLNIKDLVEVVSRGVESHNLIILVDKFGKLHFDDMAVIECYKIVANYVGPPHSLSGRTSLP